MKINRAVLAPVLVALVAMATGGWFLQRGAGQERNVYANAQLFEQVLSYVSQVFVDQKDPSELYQMAIDGLLQELGDPHTGFLPAKEYENLRIQTQGEYGGLGISILKRAGWVTIVTPLPETPGEQAGLFHRLCDLRGEHGERALGGELAPLCALQLYRLWL